MEIADRLEATIAPIVAEQDKPLLRMQLVKLVYLADYLYYRHHSKTITGLTYAWHHHGPYHHAIPDVADRLTNKGFLCLTVGHRSDGDPYYLYQKREPYQAEVLSESEVRFIQEIVRDYGKLPLPRLVEISKKTEPFNQALQYDLLTFKADASHQELDQKLRRDQKLLAEVASLDRDIKAGKVKGVKLEDLETEDAA